MPIKLSDIFSEAFAEKDTGKVFKNIISILSRRTGENFSGQSVPIPVVSGGKKLWTLLYLSDNKGIRFNWASKDTSNQITSITVWPSAKSAPIVSKDSLSGLNLIQIVNLASQMLKGETGEVEVEDAESEKMAAVNEALDVITEASLKEKAKKYAKKKAKEKDIPVEPEPVKRGRGRPRKIRVGSAPPEHIDLTFGDKELFGKETPKEVFEKIGDYIKLLDKGKAQAVLVTGDPGIGKTHEVESVLDDLGYKKIGLEDILEIDESGDEETIEEDVILEARQKKEKKEESKKIPKSAYKKISGKIYVKVSGAVASPLNIYKILFFANLKNKDAIVLFDDCDSVLEKGDGANILKAALDSKKERTISYVSTKLAGFGLPQSFTLTARVIFISNKHKEEMEEAMVSRNLVADVNFSLEDIIKRIEQILPDLDVPGATSQDKKAVLAFLKQRVFGNKEVQKVVKKFDIRTFGQIVSIKLTGNKNWQRWAAQTVISKFARYQQ